MKAAIFGSIGGVAIADGSGPGEVVEGRPGHLARACPFPAAHLARRPEAHGGRFLPTRLAGAFGFRPLSGGAALALALTLSACGADPVSARVLIEAWGYTGVSVQDPPMFGRPCGWSEPYSVRFTAHDESGALVSGWLCAPDESAEDGRLLLDREAAR